MSKTTLWLGLIYDNDPCDDGAVQLLWNGMFGHEVDHVEVEWTLEHTVKLAKLDGGASRFSPIGAVGWLVALGIIPDMLCDADLRGMDLGGRAATQSGRRVGGACFNGCALTGADLRGMDLRACDFSASIMTGANLEGARIDGANFHTANMSRCNMVNVSAQGVRMPHAAMRHANLAGADLRAAQLSRVDLRKANLTGAQLERSDMTGAWLGGAISPPPLDVRKWWGTDDGPPLRDPRLTGRAPLP